MMGISFELGDSKINDYIKHYDYIKTPYSFLFIGKYRTKIVLVPHH